MEQLCPWEGAKFLIYSSNVPTLLFYSHIPAIIIALLVGFLVFIKSGKSKVGATLFVINILFSLWCIFDLILWATNKPSIVMFFWSMQILIEPLIYLLGFYMTYLFTKKQDLSFRLKLLVILLYSPVIILLSSHYNIVGVNLGDCTAIESFIAQYFTYILEFIFVTSIFLLIDREYKKNLDTGRKNEILTFGLGVIVFLLAFSWGNLIGSFTDDWTLAQFGLIGMPIFIGFLAYLVIKFHTFNIKLFATQVFVWSLAILIGAQFFFIKIAINFILTGITFVASIIFGYLLIKSVTKEIKQKEELAKLNVDLETLIKQRESLMHLITHKVKGSFTHSKYIFAGILDGTFGAINPDLQKMAEKGLESDNVGINTIDLILNTGNMQKGLIKYEMKKVDFKDIVLNSLSEKKVAIEAKGLKIEKEVKEDDYSVSGDAFWLKEAVNNFIENSIKYTKIGKITIGLEKKNSKILFSVKDTGVGITDEDKKNLFTEGGRGKESVKVNVDSTGYGLFTVKLIIEAHKGRVWAESEGPGKGSQFYIELPVVS
jgi:signal transduction histidine kinase